MIIIINLFFISVSDLANVQYIKFCQSSETFIFYEIQIILILEFGILVKLQNTLPLTIRLQMLLLPSHCCIIGSLSTRVFETRMATGSEHFTCQNSGVCQIFILMISNGEKVLNNVNVVA